MKILIINDFYSFGGAEIQAILEKKILEQNNQEVFMITLDNDCRETERNHYNIYFKSNKVSYSIHKFFVNHKLFRSLREHIEDIDPDVIHLHNIHQQPITVIEAVKGYKVIRTLHDYYAVCPRVVCVDMDLDVCEGYGCNNCLKKCHESNLNFVKILRYKHIIKLNKKYVSYFISPSQKLAKYCRKHGYNIRCINNPFDFDKIRDFKKDLDTNVKTYIYLGTITRNKGVLELVEAFTAFKKNKNVQLLLAGKGIDQALIDKISNLEKIEYLGEVAYDKIFELLAKTYAIVIPSVWVENYPNTALEGKATYNLLVCSNRGGIPEISKDKGVLFDVKDKEAFVAALNRSYNLESSQYLNMITNAYDDLLIDNNYDVYYQKYMEVVQELGAM